MVLEKRDYDTREGDQRDEGSAGAPFLIAAGLTGDSPDLPGNFAPFLACVRSEQTVYQPLRDNQRRKRSELTQSS